MLWQPLQVLQRIIIFLTTIRTALSMFQARAAIEHLARRAVAKSVRCTRATRGSAGCPARNSSSAAQGESAAPLLVGHRHGVEDAVVTLDVGGTLFHTLRSTVACNEVLSDYVRRADANPALAKDGAVFVDRDPKHFGVLLNHLRNKTEGLVCVSVLVWLGTMLVESCRVFRLTTDFWCMQCHRTTFKGQQGATVQLPTDSAALRDIYLEAEFFGMQELSSRICTKSVMTWVAKVHACPCTFVWKGRERDCIREARAEGLGFVPDLFVSRLVVCLRWFRPWMQVRTLSIPSQV